MSESIMLHVDNLYAKAIEAVKLCTVLSSSTAELISTLGYINSEVRF
jgi:hypothetical protein